MRFNVKPPAFKSLSRSCAAATAAVHGRGRLAMGESIKPNGKGSIHRQGLSKPLAPFENLFEVALAVVGVQLEKLTERELSPLRVDAGALPGAGRRPPQQTRGDRAQSTEEVQGVAHERGIEVGVAHAGGEASWS